MMVQPSSSGMDPWIGDPAFSPVLSRWFDRKHGHEDDDKQREERRRRSDEEIHLGKEKI
jgi:hypothetical protein